jgi:1-acyl-sn-glycerol-3-phosphate acyltransferase
MFSYLRSVLWMCPLIGLSVIVMGSISLLASLFDTTGRLQHRVAVRWARMVLSVCMVKVDVQGGRNLDQRQSYVFVSNHFSLIDTPVMFGSMPREFRILARHNLWRIPFLGWHLNRAGHIPVHRENPRAAARNIGQAAEKLRAGYSILLFPEGGRTREPVMRRFKPGAAHIAIRAQVPIVPMALIGTRKILPPSSAHLHPGRAILRIGVPIPTDGLEAGNALALMARAEEEVKKLGAESASV